MKPKLNSGWRGLLASALCGLLFLSLSDLIADQAPAGTCCQPWGPTERDVREYIDSCLTTPKANCNNPQWCVVLGGLPDSWYCADWPQSCGSESVCNGFPVTANVVDGYCQWGTVRPPGECFCLYDEQKPPVPITVYDCSS
jgi:hypothetical protein